MPSPARVSGRTVTALLTDAGVVTEEQVQEGLARQRETGRRIGETLVEMGFVTDEDIGWALAHQLGIPLVDVRVDAIDADLVREFPEGLLHRLEAIPLVRAERSLSVAVCDPTDDTVVDEIERAARCPVQVSIATRRSIRAALHEILGPAREPEHGADGEHRHFDVVWDRGGASFLLFHLSSALSAGASEIHFLPCAGELRVHHRIGGRLVQVASEPPEITYSLLARLSALGGPAIDDRDQHATGQVVCPHGNQRVLLDVSLLNHDHGIAVTLGVRPIEERPPALDELGMEAIDLARIRAALDPPSGLALVTGPVRSGCSTTLSCLAALAENSERRSIAFETRPGPPLPADTRVPLPAARAREAWQEIVTAQNADVVILSDVLPGEAIGEALATAGAGRLVLASTDWTDTFSLIEFLMSQPRLRSALAARLKFVVQQRLARVPANGGGSLPANGGGSPPATRIVFEILHVTEPMRRLLEVGDPGRALRTTAEADGWRPLAARVRALEDAGVIGAHEAARLTS